jgi:hypothetical protein
MGAVLFTLLLGHVVAILIEDVGHVASAPEFDERVRGGENRIVSRALGPYFSWVRSLRALSEPKRSSAVRPPVAKAATARSSSGS